MAFPVDNRFIARAESELGRTLPASLVARLLRDNGGEIGMAGDDWQLFPVFDDSDRKRIARTCNHLLLETGKSRDWRGFPPEALAIAGNGSGDRLILLPDDSGSFGDTVFLWDHETGAAEPVADSVPVH